MSRDKIYERLNSVFQDVFDDESLLVNDETTASDVKDWDSLMHITLISEIEDEFDVRFKMKEVTNMKNVGEMVDKIMELLS